jgi:hypothetical protein
MSTMSPPRRWAAVLAGVALAAATVLPATAASAGTSTTATATTGTPAAGSAFRAAGTAGVVGRVPGYGPDVANEEAYWYSRYAMMTLTMQSGLGTPIPMDASFMAMMQQMMASVGAAPSDPVMAPVNPTLLSTFYAGGDPHYVTAPNQSDFSTLRWVGGPKVLSTEATATTIEKELEWAKLFHRDAHFGQAGLDTFGSTQRFAGMLFAATVKTQLHAYLADRSRYATTNAGNYALLTALADGAGLYSGADQANNQGPNAGPAIYPAANRYADPAAAAEFAALAKSQLRVVLASHPGSIRDLSLAIQSVVWYASSTQDRADLTAARAAITAWGNRLRAADAEGPAALAYQVRGLVEAGRVTGRDRFLQAAATAFTAMTARFDAVHGILHGTETLTTDDVAAIAGAFNAARLFLGTRIDQAAATATFGAWWEGTVNLSGLEISSPAVDQLKMPYELLDPPGRGITPQPILDYRYPTVPLPADAGGPHGIAPVLAASITWDGHRWIADSSHFDTAGAMHAADEFIWFHSDEINGFPTVNLR